MAYAVVLSLMKILERILCCDRDWVLHEEQQIESLQETMIKRILRADPYCILNKKQRIKYLLEKFSFLLYFLENYSVLTFQDEKNLEIKIRDAAHKAEDIIEIYISTQFLSKYKRHRYLTFCQDLKEVGKETHSILEEIEKIKYMVDHLNYLRPRNYLPIDGSRNAFSDKIAMVGFDEDLMKIKELVTSTSSKLEIISIVGMGGIGKTTLARSVFADSLIEYHFDIRAWITVSQHYHLHEILTGVLDSTGHLSHQDNIEKLAECLYKSLKGRRYLIIMDDIWDTKAWEDVKRLFPDDNNGSRIILTTRLRNVAVHATPFGTIHHLSLLSSDDSWNLLYEKVFGGEYCPTYLEEIGRDIARNCQGLPLSIVVVGGLLLKHKTVGYWKKIAATTNSLVSTRDGECSKILSLSYNHLPPHLKPCFLYLGVFPEDRNILVSKLIKLWVAEGFLKPDKSKSLEDVAVDYLEDLLNRSLVLVHKVGSDGKVKTYRIHDLLRDLCIREAQREKLIHVTQMSADLHSVLEGINSQRRVSILPVYHFYFDNIYTSAPLTRSLLHFDSTRVELGGFRLLRVLDLAAVNSFDFLDWIGKLVHLSYLSASTYTGTFNNEEEIIPASVSTLWNLQTLIVLPKDVLHALYLPLEIWNMPQLRHMQLSNGYLPDPPSASKTFIVLSNLQTLSLVRNFKFTDEIIKRIPKLKKLGVTYAMEFGEEWSDYCLSNLVHLHELETLKFICWWGTASLPSFTFPLSLKKLTLKGCNLPWEDLLIVGSLPNLQVLKLLTDACRGEVWEPVEGEFCQLKFLKLENLNLAHWRADSSHFPRLERLHLRKCTWLKEIPDEIGGIQTLELIQLDFCSSSVVSSAQRIQEEQQDMGNDNLQVRTIELIPITGKFTHSM